MARNFDPAAAPAVDRASLERELLEVMTSWTTRERGPAFKNWHRHALSLVHLNVITVLEAEGPTQMRRMAEALDVSDASATGIVDRMEKRGLVERRHDTADRRVVLVGLTDEGRNVFSKMVEHRRQLLVRVLAELSADEVAALLTGMRAVQAVGLRMMEQNGGAGWPPPSQLPDAPPAGE